MAVIDDIAWFKNTFADKIVPRLQGTPIPFDLVCAIAYQEAGELWSRTRHHLPVREVLRLAVGDTLDAPNRSAFPRDKAQLLSTKDGDEMFAVAHRLLREMAAATGIEAYQRVARKPNKFVHGFGLFQIDLQWFRSDPDFFLHQQWQDIDVVTAKMLAELLRGVSSLGYEGRTVLSDAEAAFLAIVYNTGFRNFRKERGLRQGHFNGSHYYGECIDRYTKLARTVPTPTIAAPFARYEVQVRSSLKVRRGCGLAFPVIRSLANRARLVVLEFINTPSGRWAAVDLDGDGRHDGYVAAAYIAPVD